MSMLRYWVWLSEAKGVGCVAAQQLIMHFGSPKNVWLAVGDELRSVPGITRNMISSLENKDLRQAEQIIAKCSSLDINIVTAQDAQYPERLSQLSDPPLLLYTRGRMLNFDSIPVVSVIGSRNCSSYGEEVAHTLGRDLAKGSAAVLSGLARGIDSCGLMAAAEAGGTVIGVLGCGIDVIYPRENAPLYEICAKRGMLISEYPPGTEPRREHFPVRNRLMSALSVAVAVIEAAPRSGTMITANRAVEQGRDVFAVPGDITRELSKGCHELIRDGAYLLTSAEDILSHYRWKWPVIKLPPMEREDEQMLIEKKSAPAQTEKETKEKPKAYIDPNSLEGLSEQELTAAKALVNGPLQVNDIAEQTGLPIAQVLAAMTVLQMMDVVIQRDGKIFSLAETE